MKRLALITNPAASGFTASLFHDVVAVLSEAFEVNKVWPESSDEARVAAAEAAADGFEIVVAMGGDGIAHQVAGAVLGTDSVLGIVPAGTMNVLARLLRLPRRPREAASHIVSSPGHRSLTVARIEASGTAGARSDVALFAAGVGFDATVVERAEREPFRKLRFGGLHYARTAIATFFSDYRHRRPFLRVEAQGRSVDAVTVFVQIHGRFTYFGKIPLRLSRHPGPTAVAIERMNYIRTARIAAQAAWSGDLASIPGVTMWRPFDRILVEADPEAPFEADGELLGLASRLELNIAPNALRVVDPATDDSADRRRPREWQPGARLHRDPEPPSP
jgi:diacylglycerol kinase family enzyme